MALAPNDIAALSTTTRVKDRRRESLVLAADQLFAGKGFEECTTSDIAMHAGVSQRTFFRYFASKEDVLLQWLDFYNLKICRSLEQRPAKEPEIEALRRALDHYTNMPASERDRSELVNRLADKSSVLRGRLFSKMTIWEERIAQVLSARGGRDPASDLRSKLLAGFSISILHTVFRETRKHGNGTELAMLIDRGFALLQSDRP